MGVDLFAKRLRQALAPESPIIAGDFAQRTHRYGGHREGERKRAGITVEQKRERPVGRRRLGVVPIHQTAANWLRCPKRLSLDPVRLARTYIPRRFKSRESAPNSFTFYRWVRFAKPPATMGIVKNGSALFHILVFLYTWLAFFWKRFLFVWAGSSALLQPTIRTRLGIGAR